jgi:hypothetical protein
MKPEVLLHVLLVSIYLFWIMIFVAFLFFFIVKRKVFSSWVRFWIHLTLSIVAGLIFQLQIVLIVRLPENSISNLEKLEWFFKLNKTNILIAIVLIAIALVADLLYSFYRLSDKKHFASIGLLVCDICVASVIFFDTLYSF